MRGVVVKHDQAARTHKRRELFRIARRALWSTVAEQQVEGAAVDSQAPVARQHLDRIAAGEEGTCRGCPFGIELDGEQGPAPPQPCLDPPASYSELGPP